MSRRRQQTTKIQRWARPAIGAIALLGVLNTGYITATKLFGGEAACPTSGCEQVLSSQYAYLFGLPLSLFGLLAYLGMAVLALAPLFVNPDTNKETRQKLENATWFPMFIGATGMMVFSAYLMYIMATQFVIPYGLKAICVYCITSAVFATAMFVLTLLGRNWEDTGKLLFTGVLVGMVVLIGSLGVYANVGRTPQGGGTQASGQTGPAIANSSGQSEIALARHLTQIGAKMYGAWWCPHCHDQKELFGREAFQQVTYVECANDGVNPQVQQCQAAADQVKQQLGENFGFPSWEINGKYFLGTQSLSDLADASGYQGPRDFQR